MNNFKINAKNANFKYFNKVKDKKNIREKNWIVFKLYYYVNALKIQLTVIEWFLLLFQFHSHECFRVLVSLLK